MTEPAQPIERKLAAIFAADVAGYRGSWETTRRAQWEPLRLTVRSWTGSSLGTAAELPTRQETVFSLSSQA